MPVESRFVLESCPCVRMPVYINTMCLLMYRTVWREVEGLLRRGVLGAMDRRFMNSGTNHSIV